jgi:hypothetical protein
MRARHKPNQRFLNPVEYGLDRAWPLGLPIPTMKPRTAKWQQQETVMARLARSMDVKGRARRAAPFDAFAFGLIR